MADISFDDLKKELNWYSTSVSTAVRTTAFGVIAAIWAVFTADGITLNTDGVFGMPTDLYVKASFIFAGAALLVDILQYVASYWMTSIGVDNWEKAERNKQEVNFTYGKECLGRFGYFLYRVSFILFSIQASPGNFECRFVFYSSPFLLLLRLRSTGTIPGFHIEKPRHMAGVW